MCFLSVGLSFHSAGKNTNLLDITTQRALCDKGRRSGRVLTESDTKRAVGLPVFLCWLILVCAIPKGTRVCLMPPWPLEALRYLWSHSNFGASLGDLQTSEGGKREA
jgi:hypothetical protein